MHPWPSTPTPHIAKLWSPWALTTQGVATKKTTQADGRGENAQDGIRMEVKRRPDITVTCWNGGNPEKQLSLC
eukprot:2101903-Amphidinium_carterae.3